MRSLARALGGTLSHGQVLAPGPGHSQADRSLSIRPSTDAPDGFVVHSFAGDDPIQCKDYVRSKLALPRFEAKLNGKRPASEDAIAQALAAAISAESKPRRPHSASYGYEDRDGSLLYEVLRYDNPKTFRQRRPDGNGGWIWQLEDRRVPYRLPDLIKYSFGTVFVCEGEKDADRLAEFDLCSTTVAAGKWTDECVQALAGRDVMVIEDNDDAGRKRALDAATLLHGVAATVRIVRLPDLPEKGDVSDWLDASRHNADKLVDVCFDAPLWKPENEITSSKDTLAEPADKSPALPFINVIAWHDQPVPEREWCVLDCIPMRNVTLFSGEGAIGKSIVSLHLAVAHVLAKDWLRSLPEPGPALVIACEDDADELHRRLASIVAHYGASFADLKRLHIVSLAGEDALLATPTKTGLIEPTKLFAQIKQSACDLQPKLIVLDNSADVFGGSENDRAQVRQFIGLLRGMAIAANARLLLTSHPSLTGISSGSGISGSTAWHASVRSRLYMKRSTTEKDEEPDPNVRVIEVMKSNYGPVGETISVCWKDGLFLPEASMGTLDRLAAEQAADNLFLTLSQIARSHHRPRPPGLACQDSKQFRSDRLRCRPSGQGQAQGLRRRHGATIRHRPHQSREV